MASAVAGIVSRHGEVVRVVVTERWRMRNHIERGERLFIVPGLEVEEPVRWEDVPRIIHLAKAHCLRTLNPDPCGECRACCFSLSINDPQLRKQPNAWCGHCDREMGCVIQTHKPRACRDFECLWLRSQRRNDVMPSELRPDRCGVFFVAGEEFLEIYVDPTRTEAMDQPQVKQLVDEQQRFGLIPKLMNGAHK